MSSTSACTEERRAKEGVGFALGRFSIASSCRSPSQPSPPSHSRSLRRIKVRTRVRSTTHEFVRWLKNQKKKKEKMCKKKNELAIPSRLTRPLRNKEIKFVFLSTPGERWRRSRVEQLRMKKRKEKTKKHRKLIRLHLASSPDNKQRATDSGAFAILGSKIC